MDATKFTNEQVVVVDKAMKQLGEAMANLKAIRQLGKNDKEAQKALNNAISALLDAGQNDGIEAPQVANTISASMGAVDFLNSIQSKDAKSKDEALARKQYGKSMPGKLHNLKTGVKELISEAFAMLKGDYAKRTVIVGKQAIRSGEIFNDELILNDDGKISPADAAKQNENKDLKRTAKTTMKKFNKLMALKSKPNNFNLDTQI